LPALPVDTTVDFTEHIMRLFPVLDDADAAAAAVVRSLYAYIK